jgi:hypothetical protein
MENHNIIYKIIIFAVCMFIPIALISSSIHHMRVEKQKVIKQKFEIVSLIFSSLINILGLGLGFTLFFFSFFIFKLINNQNYTLDLILIVFGIILLFGGVIFILSSVFFFRHLYFESSRNVFFEKETGKIIVHKYKVENCIDLNSPNIKIIKYIAPLNKYSSFGKTEIYDDENKIIISGILDLTPELSEKITNHTNKEIIQKNLNWI